MTGLLRTVIHRPVLVTVVYAIVLLFGMIAYSRLSIDVLPEVQPPVLTVVTPFPGASATDIERKVSEPLEDAMGSLTGLQELQSTSRDNVGIVTLIFDMGYDLTEATSDVRQKLDSVELPDGTDDPRILKFDAGAVPAVVFGVTDATGDVRLQKSLVRKRIVEPIERIEGVGSVVLRNAPDPIVRIDVDRDRLVSAGVTLSELAQIIGAENVDVPAGSIDVGQMQFSVRMSGEADELDDLRNLIVMRSPIGEGVVRLGDIATITEGLDDSKEVSLLNGKPAMIALVLKLSDANTVEVSNEVKQLLNELNEELPTGMKAEVIQDPSEFIEAMVNNLTQTVLVGGVLVFIVVFAFLRKLGPSIVVATTIPTSMVTTFMVLYRIGYTLNSVTLMAMALAIGMVVDNGIVVLENIERNAAAGMKPKDAALAGGREVGGALLASTATTLVIFLPMSFASGIIGTMFGQLAYVMVTTIASSLVVAITLTPMLAARAVKQGQAQSADESGDGRLARIYERVLNTTLRWPITTMALAFMGVLVTLVLMAAVSTDFIPRQDQGRASIVLELPVGTALEETATVAKQVADAYRDMPEVRIVTEYAGISNSAQAAATGGAQGSHIATVRVFMTPKTQRTRSDIEIMRAGLAEVGVIPEVVSQSVTYGDDGGLGLSGKPVVVQVIGSNHDGLESVALDLERAIRRIPGAVDVSSDLPETRPELQVDVSRELSNRAGVPFGLAANELRIGLTGVVPTRFSSADGGKDVVLRLKPEDRDEIRELGMIPVRASNKTLMRLSDISLNNESNSPIEIKRLDKARIVTVSAGVEGRALGDVTAEVNAILAKLETPEGVTARIGGTSADQAETFQDLTLLAVLGMILVYLVMAAQFESWLDPFVILLSVPFAITGAFLALLVTGTTLSMTSFLGLIILIGVVVNNAIVLIDYIKLLQSEGMDRIEAVVVGGRRRLRPVLITTLTTTGGMIPMAIANGIGGELWSPMGRTALGGLLVSTGVTLVLVPVVYVLVDRLRTNAMNWWWPEDDDGESRGQAAADAPIDDAVTPAAR